MIYASFGGLFIHFGHQRKSRIIKHSGNFNGNTVIEMEHYGFCLFTYTEIITLYQNTIEIYFLLISRLKISILQKSPTFGHRHSLKKKASQDALDTTKH